MLQEYILAAAFELRKLGFDITIFKAENRQQGGRIYTHYFDRERKLYDELGAMRVPVSHEISWHYINLFKLNTIPFIQMDPNSFYYIRGRRVRRDSEGINMVQEVYPQFNLTQRERDIPWLKLYSQVAEHFLSTLTPEIRKQFLMILLRYSPEYEAIMNISEHQALEMFGLSSEAINLIFSAMPISGVLSDSSYETSLNEEYSMDFTNLYRIEGGMVNLPLSFYKSLTSRYPKEYGSIPQDALGRVTWMSGAYVTGVHKSKDNEGIVLAYRIGVGNEVMYDSFDYGICAAHNAL